MPLSLSISEVKFESSLANSCQYLTKYKSYQHWRFTFYRFMMIVLKTPSECSGVCKICFCVSKSPNRCSGKRLALKICDIKSQNFIAVNCNNKH